MGRGEVPDVRIHPDPTPETHPSISVCRSSEHIVRCYSHHLLPSLRSGRYHQHSVNLTGPCCSDGFHLCLNGLNLIKEMFQDAIGSGTSSVYEPIKHLRRGVEIQIVAPKVSAHCAACASTAIECTELIEVSVCLRGQDGAIRCVSLSCVAEGLIALPGDTKYPGVQWYPAV